MMFKKLHKKWKKFLKKNDISNEVMVICVDEDGRMAYAHCFDESQSNTNAHHFLETIKQQMPLISNEH